MRTFVCSMERAWSAVAIVVVEFGHPTEAIIVEKRLGLIFFSLH